MVTSHKIDEKKMGYRGSKSLFFKNSVKEQRVDGSWCFNNKLLHLRYTLTGFERNYQVKIPSKQLNIRPFYTYSIKNEQGLCNLYNNNSLIDP
jgi:hypothetical protein